MTRARLLPLAWLAASLPVAAQAQDGRLDLADGADTAWVLAAACLGMLALPGLALLHAGQVRRKNAVSAMLQTLLIAFAASLLWIVAGYTIAFGDVGGGWLGRGNAWMLIALGALRAGTGIPESAYAWFQMAFAALAPALMAGAWAERARLGWVIAFAALWSLVVYAPVAHWVWGGGWLAAGVGTLDWAGGLVVHTTAGVSALVVAVMLGRRKGVAQGAVTPHAPLLSLAGAGLVWIGALALGGGAALTANDDAAAAILATHAAAAGAALAWLAIERIAGGKPTSTAFTTGLLAGLAAIAPAAGFVSPGGALALGIAGALVCRLVLPLLRRKLMIDDALGVFAVHGVGGITGALLTAPLLSESLGGVGYAPGMNALAQALAQALGVAVVLAWTAMASVVLALMVSLVVPMRVSEDAEREGLDAASHGEQAWDHD
ncbi:ammonium transporter [Novosphingobium soli]|uniref:Ammonium transporter n=1 Tax=Novosphingobium soli TaxID=574956 RepID=A0ABV6CT06_9SPHN